MQGGWTLLLWENVRLPFEAGRGQVSNYLGEVHEEVWEDGPLQVCHESHGHKVSPWKPWPKDEPCISKIERLTLIFVRQVGPNLKFWRFSNLKVVLSFLDLTLNFCMWSQYLFRFKLSMATLPLRQLFYWYPDWDTKRQNE